MLSTMLSSSLAISSHGFIVSALQGTIQRLLSRAAKSGALGFCKYADGHTDRWGFTTYRYPTNDMTSKEQESETPLSVGSTPVPASFPLQPTERRIAAGTQLDLHTTLPFSTRAVYRPNSSQMPAPLLLHGRMQPAPTLNFAAAHVSPACHSAHPRVQQPCAAGFEGLFHRQCSSTSPSSGSHANVPTAPCSPAESRPMTASAVSAPSVSTDAAPGLHLQQPHVIAALGARVQGRIKGISRKFLLRMINRRVVRQMVRRATIGIPVLGFFFISKLLVKDVQRVQAEWAAGRTHIAALFAVAVCCDAMDLLFQGLVITGIANGNFGFGVAIAADILAMADRGGPLAALVSFSAGVSGELLTVLREEREAEAQHAGGAAGQAGPASNVETKLGGEAPPKEE